MDFWVLHILSYLVASVNNCNLMEIKTIQLDLELIIIYKNGLLIFRIGYFMLQNLDSFKFLTNLLQSPIGGCN